MIFFTLYMWYCITLTHLVITRSTIKVMYIRVIPHVVQTHTNTHTHTHTHTHKHTHTNEHTCLFTYIHVYTHTNIHACTHACTHTHTHTHWYWCLCQWHFHYILTDTVHCSCCFNKQPQLSKSTKLTLLCCSNEKPSALMAETLLRNSNMHILRGIVQLGQLLTAKPDTKDCMKAVHVFHT